jgi:hypothetical protein
VRRSALIATLALLAASCGGSSSHERRTSGEGIRWRIVAHVLQPVDLSAQRADGRLTLAAHGRQFIFAPPSRLTPFARGPGGYSTQLGLEPYIALTPPVSVPGTGCSFGRDQLYVLQPSSPLGLLRIDASGRVRPFASLPPGGVPNGITFDQGGRFGHRLLVTEEFGTRYASVYGFDCRGRRRTIARRAPRLEGGIAVAPAGFGAFGGTLVATNEYDGNNLDISPSGRSRVLIGSGLPAGSDLGVESIGFVPSRSASAYVSDRYTPRHRYPGDNAILELSARALRSAGARPGDLLVATEGRGLTDDVRCAERCTVRYLGKGPARAYIEGHIEFAG